MLVLPISFLGGGGRGIWGVGGSVDGLLGIDGRAIGVPGNMGGGYGLSGGAGGRAGGCVCAYFTGSSMGVEGSLANECHFEYACV